MPRMVTVRVAALTSDDARNMGIIAVPNNRNFMASPPYVVIIRIALHQPWYNKMLLYSIFVYPFRHFVIDMDQLFNYLGATYLERICAAKLFPIEVAESRFRRGDCRPEYGTGTSGYSCFLSVQALGLKGSCGSFFVVQ